MFVLTLNTAQIQRYVTNKQITDCSMHIIYRNDITVWTERSWVFNDYTQTIFEKKSVETSIAFISVDTEALPTSVLEIC